MSDQDEMFEAATELPAVMGCPSLGPKTLPGGFDGVGPAEKEANGQDARSTKMDPLTPEEQSDLDRALAREKRIIRWRCYETKIDLCAMGKTKQNGKVYEVRIVKRDEGFKETSYSCKVNGKTVLTGVFTGGAWMLKRILTAGMQGFVNYKAKRNRDRRRHFAKRDAAKENGGQA